MNGSPVSKLNKVRWLNFNGIMKGYVASIGKFSVWCVIIVIHLKNDFSFLVVVSSDEEGPVEHKSSEILKLQPKQDHVITNDNESTSEAALSEPLMTCESVQVIYFCFLID